MDCMITNQDKKIYIRLNGNGQPETCVKSVAQKFTDTKARNILNNLPRTLKHFNFMIVTVPDDEVEKTNKDLNEIKDISTPGKTIKNENYIVPNTVTSWMDRIEKCNNLVVEAKHRKDELFEQLSDVDKDLSNCLHIIEMTKWKSGCDGYKEYKKIKQILEKRRVIKDELSVVQSLASCDINHFSVDHVVNKLVDRSFAIRETDSGTVIL